MTFQNITTLTKIRPAALGVALLCFLLPLFNIKCSSPIGGEMKIANVKGYALVTGGSIVPNKDIDKQWNKTGKGIFGESSTDTDLESAETEIPKTKPETNKKEKDIKPNVFAIFALVFIIAALIFSFIQIKSKNIAIAIASALSFLSLVILAFTIKSTLGFGGGVANPKEFDLSMLKVVPAIGFYLISVCVLTAAVISYLFYKNEQEELYARSLEAELLQTDEEHKNVEDSFQQITE
jgi:lysylphosphatidylglycerol synthetase-like protein (DUF2156 family)